MNYPQSGFYQHCSRICSPARTARFLHHCKRHPVQVAPIVQTAFSSPRSSSKSHLNCRSQSQSSLSRPHVRVTLPTRKLADPKLSRPTTARHKSTQRAESLAAHFSTSSHPSSSTSSTSKSTMSYTSRKIGAPHTLEHRVFVEKDGVPVSPFHDIPLYANQSQTILNMIVEVPRWTNAKMEVRSSMSPVAIRPVWPPLTRRPL